jgi:hypothetical protein
MPNDRAPQHHHAGLRILGSPKTVNLQGELAGHQLEGPLEVWVAALVATLDADQRARFCTIFEAVMRQREQQKGLLARVVADIPMPKVF